MVFVSNERGYEVTAIFKGVPENIINDLKLLKNTSLNLLKNVGFTVINFSEHKFQPRGYTFIVLLSESHFAVHTYPEHSSVYVHLYSCGERDEKIIIKGLKDCLQSTQVDLNKKSVIVGKNN